MRSAYDDLPLFAVLLEIWLDDLSELAPQSYGLPYDVDILGDAAWANDDPSTGMTGSGRVGP